MAAFAAVTAMADAVTGKQARRRGFVHCQYCQRLLALTAEGKLPPHGVPPQPRAYPAAQTILPARRPTWCEGTDQLPAEI